MIELSLIFGGIGKDFLFIFLGAERNNEITIRSKEPKKDTKCARAFEKSSPLIGLRSCMFPSGKEDLELQSRLKCTLIFLLHLRTALYDMPLFFPSAIAYCASTHARNSMIYSFCKSPHTRVDEWYRLTSFMLLRLGIRRFFWAPLYVQKCVLIRQRCARKFNAAKHYVRTPRTYSVITCIAVAPTKFYRCNLCHSPAFTIVQLLFFLFLSFYFSTLLCKESVYLKISLYDFSGIF